MKILITEKGIVDCTSDSRTHHTKSFRKGIECAIKILDKEVLELDYARFSIENEEDKEIKMMETGACLKLLNFYKNSTKVHDDSYIHIRVKLWKFFNDGNGCSDYIDIYSDRLEVSCQDDYDPDDREKFHENIEHLLEENYVVTIDDELISLHINVTEKCQSNCKTCYITKGLQRELKKEDWSNLPLAGQYAIGGGEPSEYKPIAELIDYLKYRDSGRVRHVAITTNGQNIIKFGKYLPDKIAVSIDGLTQEEHSITHNTDLDTAKKAVETYRSMGINICINHVLHRHNIDDVEKFIDSWKEDEINFILFIGEDSLKPTFEQLFNFKKLFDRTINESIMIDSCMAGLLDMFDSLGKKYICHQGLYSEYYRFGSITPCSHSHERYPKCGTIEDYMKYFFKTLRPIVFIYEKDGTSGAHEWAFKIGFRGKIKHVIDKPLRKDVIYIVTSAEEGAIEEHHYTANFKDKMPFWLS